MDGTPIHFNNWGDDIQCISDVKKDVKESYELWDNEGYVYSLGDKSAHENNSMEKYPNIKLG
jgi:hypothetical protein